jgi:hypothetical protein
LPLVKFKNHAQRGWTGYRSLLQASRGRGTILAMLLLLLLSMLIGWLIGGPDRESRRVLATATSMRNVIVVLYVARYCFPGTSVYHDSDCLYIADGAHEPAFPSRVRRMAHTEASGGGVGRIGVTARSIPTRELAVATSAIVLIDQRTRVTIQVTTRLQCARCGVRHVPNLLHVGHWAAHKLRSDYLVSITMTGPHAVSRMLPTA